MPTQTKKATRKTKSVTRKTKSATKRPTKRASTRAQPSKRAAPAKRAPAKRKVKVMVADPENYAEVTKTLRERLRSRAPVSYDRGRDRMRQHIEDHYKCTPTRARHIVSSLVQRGFVRFGPHPNFHHDRTIGCWTYHPTQS